MDGRFMALWVKASRGRTPTMGYRVVLDTEHALVVLVNVAVGALGIILVHMPRRSEATEYRQVTEDVAMVKNAHPGVRFLAIGDWNRHVPTQSVNRRGAVARR